MSLREGADMKRKSTGKESDAWTSPQTHGGSGR